MSFAMVGAAAITATAGMVKAITGAVQAKKAREEKKREQAELQQYKEQFAQLDTSNPFANMENVFEDLTVNQQQAEFTKQQQQQSQANILQQTRGAAGASGIAALAQTLARQGSLDAQQAGVSIGEQERANQLMKQQEAGKIQTQEIQGDIMQREAEASKLKTLMGMQAADAEAAARDEMMAKQAMYEGIGGVAEAGMGLAGGLASQPKKEKKVEEVVVDDEPTIE